MEKTTSIKLGSHFEGLIASFTNSGRYKSTSEVIRAGLRLLEKQEAEEQVKLEALRQALIEGEESGESNKSHADILAEVKAELNAG